MSATSTIEWTNATWNPARGCDKVSPGCKNCYAKTFAERWRGIRGHPFEYGFDLRLVPEKAHGSNPLENTEEDLRELDVGFVSRGYPRRLHREC